MNEGAASDDGTNGALTTDWTPGGLRPLELGGRIPGPVIPYGAGAVVLASADGYAIAAATRTASGGLVVALGHDGLWGAAAGERTIAAFLQRVLTWCAAGRPEVGLIERAEADRVAAAAGLRPTTLRHARDAGRVGTVIVRGDALDGDAGAVDALTSFVEAGGSVIVDSTPWGWLQLHEGTLREDHGANRLVRRFGLCFADGLVEPGRAGAYAVDRHDRGLHGLEALAALRAGRPSAVASATLLALVGELPEDEPFLGDVRAVAGSCDPFSITPQRPIRAHDAGARLAARLWLSDQHTTMPRFTLMAESHDPPP